MQFKAGAVCENVKTGTTLSDPLGGESCKCSKWQQLTTQQHTHDLNTQPTTRAVYMRSWSRD